LSGQGVQVASSPTNTPAPTVQGHEFEQNLMSRANAALDDLLELLELNKKTFTSYKGSDTDLLIRSAAEFSKYGGYPWFQARIPGHDPDHPVH